MRMASSPGTADSRDVAAVKPSPAFNTLYAQHQKAVAHVAHYECVELVLNLKGTVQLFMLEVTLTTTKEYYTSDYNSVVKKTVFWLVESLYEKVHVSTLPAFVT